VKWNTALQDEWQYCYWPGPFTRMNEKNGLSPNGLVPMDIQEMEADKRMENASQLHTKFNWMPHPETPWTALRWQH